MKPHVALVFLVVAAPALAGPTITVTAPRTGAHWCLGRTYRVAWSSPGTSANVAIQLARAGAPARTLVAATKDDESEDVTVPPVLEPGAYVVRVRTLTRPVILGESPAVSIEACVAIAPPALELAPSIRVTYPDSGSSLALGNVLPVRWSSTGPVPETPLTVTLQTPRCEREVRLLSAATANDGHETFTAPPEVAEGDYAVQVGIFGGRIQGCSPTFRLNSVLSFVEPTRATAVHPGDRLTVRWHSRLGGTVRLGLTDKDRCTLLGGSLASSTANDGEADVVIPADTVPGTYRISGIVNEGDWASTCFLSERFRVVAAPR